MDVSIIMINYNTYELTCDALDCIFTYTQGLAYEVILIDNASPDGSGSRLAEKYENRIIFIQSYENLGTSKAFNLGAKRARGKYVLWLNTDILFTDDFVNVLYRYLEENNECGVCGGNLLDFGGRPTHSFRRDIPDCRQMCRDNSLFVQGYRKLYKKIFRKSPKLEYNYSGKPTEVGYVTGADMMIRRELFDEIGLFDEKIFMYCEESEFQFRVLKNTPYKIISVPYARMVHLEGASFGKNFNEKKFRIQLESSIYYLEKCYDKRSALKYLKSKKKAYILPRLAFCLLFKKDKAQECQTKRKIIGEYIGRYTAVKVQ